MSPETMKCHFVYDKEYGKVLIPECWSVVMSNNMEDCTCRDKIETFAQFEKKEYKEILLKKNQEISELEKEVAQLYRIIKKLCNNDNRGTKKTTTRKKKPCSIEN